MGPKTKIACDEGRTLFRSQVKSPAAVSILKPSMYNRKIGDTVQRGEHKGAKMFHVSLEERATCPRTCKVWAECYGNNMQFAHRIDHRHPDFVQNLSLEVNKACDTYKKVMVRLHVLGDFYSYDYVLLWRNLLGAYSNLNVFGYTAHTPYSQIGSAIDRVSQEYGWGRFAVRFSGAQMSTRAALVGDEHPELDTFWCPEQEDKANTCAECCACWNGDKTVRFEMH